MVEVPRKVSFIGLQVLVAVEGVVLAAQGVIEFLAAAGGDPTPLFVSAILFLVAAALLYLAIGLRSRGSTPFFATLVSALLAVLLLAALGFAAPSRLLGILLALAILVALLALRGRFQLRPGEFVKEEKLPPEVIARIATRVRGVRCRECGDDDVWITTDKEIVCKNCGSTDA